MDVECSVVDVWSGVLCIPYMCGCGHVHTHVGCVCTH